MAAVSCILWWGRVAAGGPGGRQEVKAGRMGFNDFLVRGLVEYVDVNEENNSLIALYEVRPRARQGPGATLSRSSAPPRAISKARCQFDRQPACSLRGGRKYLPKEILLLLSPR